MEVVHMTTGHLASDRRIFDKMCRSLAHAGHRVHLVAPCSEASEVERREGVSVHRIARPGNRWVRASKTALQVLRRATGIPADIYHFHDPELLGYAMAFQRRVGRPLVYDAHEDIRLQVYSKSYIPSWGRGMVSRAVGRVEDYVAARCAGVVAATPAIARRFASHPNCVVVQNLPVPDDLKTSDSLPLAERAPLVAYVGGISRLRGACEMAAAMALLPEKLGARLALLGRFYPPKLADRVRQIAGSHRVELLAWGERHDVAALLARARIGIVTILPARNYLESQPIKLFEYMSVGIPVVVSDFPLLRETVRGIGCGLCVDPQDPRAIAGAIRWLLEHPEEAEEMGRRGQRAVAGGLNWHGEFQVLLSLYERICGRVAAAA